MTINYDEKRDFQRMTVECDVSYIVEGTTEKFSGKGTDLSATGVMFSASQDLALGTILEIHIHPYIKTVRSLTAKAEVIRNSKEGDSFIIGVKMYDVE
ncbi:MAG: PilZ domain-containing protein [Pseudomonadota bacterium]